MDGTLAPAPDFLASVLAGLGRAQKRLEAKWFYDAAGSALFEEITQLPEYYPTRTEAKILRESVGEIAARVPEGAALVELGSGASVKTRILLDHLTQLSAYLPMDISEAFLAEVAAGLARDYPALDIVPVAGDFMGDIAPPEQLAGVPKVAFFPGSTIGNLSEADAVDLLARVCGWDGIEGFILGMDRVKDAATLIAAYDDAAGVTARFNLNVLARINRELGGTFDLDAFRHEARWNGEAERIEMHLVAMRPLTARVGPAEFIFAEGESIHTENSHKYTRTRMEELAARGGWRVETVLSDADEMFSVVLLAPA
ncbi:L-histidine N(alpha)-methyltransferase [Pontivivens ytuae]|uniref:L-histidine N(Alpha)-methyltransferase n=1 Tax=Pontivivens ytuae TaxID=2789856 RepID=A0A7S9LQX6_9RHOB|nr:L-histidine N(alpha)-methyltransferase [Pontivivens ytuae]QPH53649.1 L-histidine N(alpha)-methyltransferase [Pontivivens ytuae]